MEERNGEGKGTGKGRERGREWGMTWEWPGNDRGMTGEWPGNDRGMTWEWPGNDRGMTGEWPGNDRGMTGVCPGNDRGMDEIRKNPNILKIFDQIFSWVVFVALWRKCSCGSRWIPATPSNWAHPKIEYGVWLASLIKLFLIGHVQIIKKVVLPKLKCQTLKPLHVTLRVQAAKVSRKI
jgi:hypothetical protein